MAVYEWDEGKKRKVTVPKGLTTEEYLDILDHRREVRAEKERQKIQQLVHTDPRYKEAQEKYYRARDIASDLSQKLYTLEHEIGQELHKKKKGGKG